MLEDLQTHYNKYKECKLYNPCPDPGTHLVFPLVIYTSGQLLSVIAGEDLTTESPSLVYSPIFSIVKIYDDCVLLQVYEIIPNSGQSGLTPEELLDLYLAGEASLVVSPYCITIELCRITGYRFLPTTCVMEPLGRIQVNNYYYTSLTNDVLNGQIVAVDPPATDQATIHYTVTTGPFHGSVVLADLTGQFTYTPDQNYSGIDYFKVRVWNKYGENKEIVVSVNVVGNPIVREQIYNAVQNTVINGEVYAVDPLGTTLTYSVSVPAQYGVVNFPNPNNPQFTYTTSDPAYTGHDSFVVLVTNALGLTSEEVISITINPVTSGPTVGVEPEQYKLLINETIQYTVTVPESGTDTYNYNISNNSTSIGTISNITISPDTKQATFDYKGNSLGIDVIKVSVLDTDTGNLTVVNSHINVYVTHHAEHISPTTDNVVATNSSTQGSELVRFEQNGEYSFIKGRYYKTDNGGIVQIEPTLAQDPQPFLTVRGQQFNWTYLSGLNKTTDAVEGGIKIQGGPSEVLPFKVKVSNDPVIIDESKTNKCAKNDSVSGLIIALNPLSGSLTFSVLTNPAHGSISYIDNEGNYIYLPNLNYIGPDQFTIGVSNSHGTTATTIKIDVLENDAYPVIYNFSPNPAITFLNFQLAGQVFVTSNPIYTLSYSITQIPGHGSATVDPEGLWIYTPDEGYLGEDQFEVTVTNNLGHSDSLIIPVTVSIDTLEPVIYSYIQTPAETYDDTSVTFGVRAFNPGDYLMTLLMTTPIMYSISAQATKGIASIDSTGLVTYTPDGLSYGIDMFEVTAVNDHGLKDTILIYIDILNQANPY